MTSALSAHRHGTKNGRETDSHFEPGNSSCSDNEVEGEGEQKKSRLKPSSCKQPSAGPRRWHRQNRKSRNSEREDDTASQCDTNEEYTENRPQQIPLFQLPTFTRNEDLVISLLCNIRHCLDNVASEQRAAKVDRSKIMLKLALSDSTRASMNQKLDKLCTSLLPGSTSSDGKDCSSASVPDDAAGDAKAGDATVPVTRYAENGGVPIAAASKRPCFESSVSCERPVRQQCENGGVENFLQTTGPQSGMLDISKGATSSSCTDLCLRDPHLQTHISSVSRIVRDNVLVPAVHQTDCLFPAHSYTMKQEQGDSPIIDEDDDDDEEGIDMRLLQMGSYSAEAMRYSGETVEMLDELNEDRVRMLAAEARSPRQFALKLLSVLFTREELAKSNIRGGEVFTGKSWVVKEPLDPQRLQRMFSILEEFYPGCMIENEKEIRNGINAKCRQVQQLMTKSARLFPN